MSWRNKNKLNKIFIIFNSLLFVLLLGVGAFLIYASDYSRAQEKAITVMVDSSLVTEFEGGVAIGNVKAQTAFLFYPGGKVEYSSYAPLLQEIAGSDILCILVKMPLNLAVLDSNAAADIIPMFPEVKHWFIGGHSLGGAMAADYASKNSEDFDGLILLAAYSTTDMASSKYAVLSLFGSEDTVLNQENFDKSRGYMPVDYQEIKIEGGNHGQFGDYGLQEGDGVATITAAKQWEITSGAVIDFVKSIGVLR